MGWIAKGLAASVPFCPDHLDAGKRLWALGLQVVRAATHADLQLLDALDRLESLDRRFHFPKALIVADRFHVIRLINHHFLACWREIDPIGSKQCAKLVPRFLRAIVELRQSGLAQLVTLGETLHSWREEIARMWRFTRSNGITEGFHNKMVTINRQAYGYRSFENYANACWWSVLNYS